MTRNIPPHTQTTKTSISFFCFVSLPSAASHSFHSLISRLNPRRVLSDKSIALHFRAKHSAVFILFNAPSLHSTPHSAVLVPSYISSDLSRPPTTSPPCLSDPRDLPHSTLVFPARRSNLSTVATLPLKYPSKKSRKTTILPHA